VSAYSDVPILLVFGKTKRLYCCSLYLLEFVEIWVWLDSICGPWRKSNRFHPAKLLGRRICRWAYNPRVLWLLTSLDIVSLLLQQQFRKGSNKWYPWGGCHWLFSGSRMVVVYVYKRRFWRWLWSNCLLFQARSESSSIWARAREFSRQIWYEQWTHCMSTYISTLTADIKVLNPLYWTAIMRAHRGLCPSKWIWRAYACKRWWSVQRFCRPYWSVKIMGVLVIVQHTFLDKCYSLSSFFVVVVGIDFLNYTWLFILFKILFQVCKIISYVCTLFNNKTNHHKIYVSFHFFNKINC
jgi:hypothetical protein